MSRAYWNEEIETISREALEVYQLKQLKEQLTESYTKSPYYKQSFDKANIKPEDLQSLEDLIKFPILTKHDVRERSRGIYFFF